VEIELSLGYIDPCSDRGIHAPPSLYGPALPLMRAVTPPATVGLWQTNGRDDPRSHSVSRTQAASIDHVHFRDCSFCEPKSRYKAAVSCGSEVSSGL
jgi:hypothetical protein